MVCIDLLYPSLRPSFTSLPFNLLQFFHPYFPPSFRLSFFPSLTVYLLYPRVFPLYLFPLFSGFSRPPSSLILSPSIASFFPLVSLPFFLSPFLLRFRQPAFSLLLLLCSLSCPVDSLLSYFLSVLLPPLFSCIRSSYFACLFYFR